MPGKNFHSKEPHEIYEKFHSSQDGLNTTEVEALRKKFGYNEIIAKKKHRQSFFS